MSLNRVLRIIGDIDSESFLKFTTNLRRLEAESSSKAIMIELASGGGIAYDALAFAGRIRNSPCNIIVRAYGFVASAAVLVLAAGDQREMASEAWVMVHEDSDKLEGEVSVIERDIAHMRRMETQWAGLLGGCTRVDAAHWAALHKKTTYLSAQECLDIGLVDKLI